MSGDRAVISAPYDDPAGSAYVFDLTTGQQIHKLIPSDGQVGDFFGLSICMEGNLVLVGASLGDTPGHGNIGSAYFFDASTGQELQKLVAPDGLSGDEFGCAVSLNSVYALVGAWEDDDSTSYDSGSAYLFDRATGQFLRKFTAAGGSTGDLFGSSVALADGVAVIGCPGDDLIGLDAGSAYVFDIGTGELVRKIVPSDGFSKNEFGRAVAGFGKLGVFGVSDDDDLGPYSGSAYVYDVVKPPFASVGSGCAGAGGVIPELAMTGSATPGGHVELGVTQAVGGGVAFLVLGLGNASVGMGFGCTLNVAPLLPVIVGPIPLLPVGAQGPGAGSANLQANLPPALVTPLDLGVQAFVPDSGAASGFANTNGIALLIQ